MKLSRNINGIQLAKALNKFGYDISRQTGSHLRLTTMQNGSHSITIPRHDPIKIGTLHDILEGVADHLGYSKEKLFEILFPN